MLNKFFKWLKGLFTPKPKGGIYGDDPPPNGDNPPHKPKT